MSKYANPRIMVTVPKDTYDVFKEYSEISDISLSKAVVSVMEETAPMYSLLIKAFKDSEGDKEIFIKRMRETLLVKSSDALQRSIDFKDAL